MGDLYTLTYIRQSTRAVKLGPSSVLHASLDSWVTSEPLLTRGNRLEQRSPTLVRCYMPLKGKCSHGLFLKCFGD
jgi:hypothetical protein